jgi:hypothetical protein
MDLNELATRHGTDKHDKAHSYAYTYEKYLKDIRLDIKRIFEIGIYNGYSARMWKEYCPNTIIHALDIDPRCTETNEDRIIVHIGDQENPTYLNKLISEIGADFDIIIDDGGHQMQQQIVSFNTLFQYVKPGGLYVIEDIHTAYWQSPNTKTTIDMLKSLIDDVNFRGNKRIGCGNSPKIRAERGHELNQFEKTIDSIHFYNSIVFILKAK